MKSELSPWQAKCKNRTPLSLDFGFTIFWLSLSGCFSAFFGVFSGDFGFHYSHSHPDSQACPWECHSYRNSMGNVPWDATGINCYGMGMGQINMSHGQP